MLGKSDRKQLRAAAPAFAPGMALKQMVKHSLDFWLTSEDLPDSDNRVLLNTQGDIALHYTVKGTHAYGQAEMGQVSDPAAKQGRRSPPQAHSTIR